MKEKTRNRIKAPGCRSLWVALVVVGFGAAGCDVETGEGEDVASDEGLLDSQGDSLDDTINLDTFEADTTSPQDVEDSPDATALDVVEVLDAPDASADAVEDAPEDATPDTEQDTGPDVVEPPSGPARYPATSLRSPINAHVVARLQAIYDRGPGLRDDVFMKVGASGTVSTRLLFCLAPEPPSGYVYDLDGRELQETIDYFRTLNPDGSTSFDRETLAAEVGRTASWVISGSPSPLTQEIAALNPRFALVNYGTNDMGMGATYQSALWPFVVNMTALLDQLEGQGIIPVITGLNPRDDNESAARWAKTYNEVTRGLAEQRQVPFIDLLGASDPLANHGLLSDGIHGNSYTVSGSAQPCIFTAGGLAYNYNQRNLLTLETLDDVRAVVLDDAPAPNPATTPWSGDGSLENPFVIDRLPFSHHADTTASAHRLISAYPACDTGQNEGGPEFYYRLSLPTGASVRWMVFDDATADLDLHLLGATGDPASCTARHDRILQGPLAAGDHTLVVDSFVSGGVERPGPYLLVVVPCEAADPDCQ